MCDSWANPSDLSLKPTIKMSIAICVVEPTIVAIITRWLMMQLSMVPIPRLLPSVKELRGGAVGKRDALLIACLLRAPERGNLKGIVREEPEVLTESILLLTVVQMVPDVSFVTG